MNRRILIEEIPDGRLVISTNFASGHPVSEMSVATISTGFYDLASDIRSLLEDQPNDPFQQGLRRMEWAARVARRMPSNGQAGDEDDDIPF